MNSGGFQKSIKSCIVLPTGCNMTSEQKAKVISLQQKIQPKNPFYITAMDKTSVAGGFLAISKNYGMKHLVDENGTIKLSQLDGSKRWTIDLDINTDGCFALSTGWMDFIRDNNLQEGDICIFQPSRSRNGVVLIFHPLEESRCPQPPGYVPYARSPRHGVPMPPYMLPRFTSLNDQQKSKVDQEVRAIQSEIPICVIVMQNSNITCRSCILQFGSEYARCNQAMRLRLPNKDHTWEAALKGRRHALGRGWRQFVEDNRLKLGDICHFRLIKDKKQITMIVHIIRKTAV
ncbi:B3 domain-containing protein LOC_Os12g40080-like isoform X1 [Phragmites australis]|uniref:B3 domain-containing protein LOC_Os12g40080-like isoform X1 n=1 Tax=Phragmites australis TaxID=29695 RepID=UPI002D79F867|nr:B3 domain-containing protein LOC_Os12g40080-like isoform X1 [Phragmites australis]